MQSIPTFPDSTDILCRLAAGQIGGRIGVALGRAGLTRIRHILEVRDGLDARPYYRVANWLQG